MLDDEDIRKIVQAVRAVLNAEHRCRARSRTAGRAASS